MNGWDEGMVFLINPKGDRGKIPSMKIPIHHDKSLNIHHDKNPMNFINEMMIMGIKKWGLMSE